MEVAVCLKSVPDPRRWSEITIDPVRKTLKKDGIPRVISPLDRHALEEAARLKEQQGGRVTVICMGGAGAEETLREALALGGDRGIFLNHPSFAGADTLATARALAAALDRSGPYDFIFCGAASYYGSTGQVGPQVARLLGIPHLGHVSRFSLARGLVRAELDWEQGTAVVEAVPPLLLTVTRDINKPRGLRLSESVRAGRKELLRWGPAELGLDASRVGLSGAGTAMVDLRPAPRGQGAELLEGDPREIARHLAEKIAALGLKTKGA